MIFPQGAERASTLRPLGFRRGAAVIAARVPEAAVVPMGIRYEVAGTQHPLAFFSLGAPLPPETDVEAGRRAQQEAVTALLEDLDQRVQRLRNGDTTAVEGFKTVLAKRPGLMERLATALLRLFTRRSARHRRALPPGSDRGPTR